MITVAYCPPLWFAFMNKRVLNHYKGDLSKANVHPAALSKMQAQYGKGQTALR